MKQLYKIKTHSPYVSGVIGKEIRLTFRERLAILFSGGIEIVLVSEGQWKEYVNKTLESDGA